MPVFEPSTLTGRVIWLGRIADRARTLRSDPVDAVRVTLDGIEGEAHSGLVRPSCSRVRDIHPKGTPIRNTRQISVASGEELAEVAHAMGLDAFEPGWIGASMVLEGIPDLSHLPPSSRLRFPSGATLTVDVENRPCRLPAEVIDEDAPGLGRRFQTAARGRRGLVAWVEREGTIRLGDAVTLFVPSQRPWAPKERSGFR